jgi:tetratricopeptide (TPR) repeat protein
MGEKVEAGLDPLSLLLGGPPAPSAAAELFGDPAPSSSASTPASAPASAAAELFGSAAPAAAAAAAAAEVPAASERRPSLSAASLFAAATQQQQQQQPFSAPAPPARPAPDLLRPPPPGADPPGADASEPAPSVPARPPKRTPQFRRIDNYNQALPSSPGGAGAGRPAGAPAPSAAGHSPPAAVPTQPPLPSRPYSSSAHEHSLMLSPLDQKVAAFMKDSTAKMVEEMVPASITASLASVQRLYHWGAWSQCLEVVRTMSAKTEAATGSDALVLFRYELTALVRLGKPADALQVLLSPRGRGMAEHPRGDRVMFGLLAADVEHHAGKTQAAVARLSVMARQLCEKVELETSSHSTNNRAEVKNSQQEGSLDADVTPAYSTGEALWSTLRQLVGYLLANNEFSSAIAVQKMMLELVGASGMLPLPVVAAAEGEVAVLGRQCVPTTPIECFPPQVRQRRIVMSLLHLTRIYLHLGDTRSALRLTEAAAGAAEAAATTVAEVDTKNDTEEKKDATALEAHVVLNRGLVQFSSSDEDKAAASFERALSLARAALDARPVVDPAKGAASAAEVAAVAAWTLSPLSSADALREVAITAANNLAVCALHRGTIFEAVAQIEAAVRENPQVFLHPQIVHNLRILYVVSLKPAAAAAKNALIARLVELYHR